MKATPPDRISHRRPPRAGGRSRGQRLGPQRTRGARSAAPAAAPTGPAATASDSYASIYAVVRRIPAGRVATYGQVAALAGLPGRARQVGYALHALPEGNPLPWQRVINARGEISRRATPGYEGFQRALLEREGVELDLGGAVDLQRFLWEPGARPPSRRPPAAGVREIAAALRPLGTARRAVGAKAYLKSELQFYGVDTPALRREARAWLHAHRGTGRAALARLVRALWQRPVHELRAFAIELLMARQALLEADDVDLLESILRRSATWAYVDPIATQVVGPLVERHPRLGAVLDRWSADPDFWLRRASLLALLRPLARGDGDWKRFVRYADAMLGEREFFVRKAIGWVLREAAKRHPRRVADYLLPRLDRIAGLTLREAIKYLPAADRQRLLPRRRA